MANTKATQRRASTDAAASNGPAFSVKSLVSTVELAASSTGDTIDFGRIPSDARILIQPSYVYWDDLATTGSPTLDLGLAAVEGNLANSDDPDALSNGHDVTSAGSGAAVGTGVDNAGLPAWDLVASETSDPGGVLKVYGTVADASTTQTGTVTLELYYYVD